MNKLKVQLAMAVYVLSSSLGLISGSNEQGTLFQYELTLGFRSDNCAKDVQNPLEFGVRNVGVKIISSDECSQILMGGKIHLLAPDGKTYNSNALGFWRTVVPTEI